MSSRSAKLADADFSRLLSLRDGIRRFLRWSEEQARSVGLTAMQHQLLLAVRGHDGAPSITDVAAHLMLKHHSAVELVDRAEQSGLVDRYADADDHRIVRLRLTASGEEKLRALSASHAEELNRLNVAWR